MQPLTLASTTNGQNFGLVKGVTFNQGASPVKHHTIVVAVAALDGQVPCVVAQLPEDDVKMYIVP